MTIEDPLDFLKRFNPNPDRAVLISELSLYITEGDINRAYLVGIFDDSTNRELAEVIRYLETNRVYVWPYAECESEKDRPSKCRLFLRVDDTFWPNAKEWAYALNLAELLSKLVEHVNEHKRKIVLRSNNHAEDPRNR